MTVAELIAKLQTFDPSLEACFYVEERDQERAVASVEKHQVIVKYIDHKPIYAPCVMLLDYH